jgi:hypothetical protein
MMQMVLRRLLRRLSMSRVTRLFYAVTLSSSLFRHPLPYTPVQSRHRTAFHCLHQASCLLLFTVYGGWV